MFRIGNRMTMGAGKLYLKKLYQKNQKSETDPKGKLVIQNFDKNITSDVSPFYGWNLIGADEMDESYFFRLVYWENPKWRVYITLGRVLQYAEQPYYPEKMYQCYIHDDSGKWQERSWFRAHDITYKNFWAIVEEVVNKHHPILPF